MKAGIYVRISSDPTGQAAGVKRQEEDCRNLAQTLGWTITEVYEDNDYSATSTKPRPAFVRLLADIEAGKLDAVVVWHPDRLYRKLADLVPLTEACKKANVDIATVRAGKIDLTTATGRMVASLVGAVSTYEGEHKAERYKRSIQQRREAGLFAPSGRRMFGYTERQKVERNDGTVVRVGEHGQVVPEEADTTRWLFKEVLAGASVTGLCKQLNAQGIYTTQGNEWRASNLKAYLLNPRLAGYATIGKKIIGDGQHEAIIDRDSWEQAKAILSTPKKLGTRPRKALLPGMIFCGNCGAPMVTGQRPPKVRTYRCMKAPGRDVCGKVSIDALPVEEMVETLTRGMLDNRDVWERVNRIQATAGASEMAAEGAALEGRVAELKAALAQPGVPVATLLQQIKSAEARIDEIHRELASLRPVAVPEKGGPWPEDLQQRRRLVEVVVSAVHIDPRPADAKHGVFIPERVRVAPA